MFENTRYDKPFLKEVIVRLDFSAPITGLERTLPPKIGNSIIQRFPITEPREKLKQELQVSPDEVVLQKKTEFIEWNFHGRNREKRLALAPASVFATYSQYSTYEMLKEDFLQILECIWECYPETRGSRLGLRYINHIEKPSGDTFSWGELLDERLLGLFSRFSDTAKLARLFHIVELTNKDLNLKYQFGMPNPDFPAPIRQAFFVLDLDGYVHGLQDLAEVSANLDRAHGQIQQLFEESITDRLREMMNER